MATSNHVPIPNKMSDNKSKVSKIFRKKDLPMFGPRSKRLHVIKLLSKQMKQVTNMWKSQTDEIKSADYETKRKSVISLALLCARTLEDYFDSDGIENQESVSQIREAMCAIGDCHRYIALATQMQLSSSTTVLAECQKHTVEALQYYDAAVLSIDVYDVKIRSLFQYQLIDALLLNMRYLISISVRAERRTFAHEQKETYTVNPRFLVHVEYTCSEIQRELANHPVTNPNDSTAKCQLVVTGLVDYAIAVFNGIKHNHRTEAPKYLSRAHSKFLNDLEHVNHSEMNHHVLHSVILVLAFLCRLFSFGFGIPPYEMSRLLKTKALYEIARSDFITEDREDQWNTTIKYVMENTDMGGIDLTVGKVIRRLNSVPMSL